MRSRSCCSGFPCSSLDAASRVDGRQLVCLPLMMTAAAAAFFPRLHRETGVCAYVLSFHVLSSSIITLNVNDFRINRYSVRVSEGKRGKGSMRDVKGKERQESGRQIEQLNDGNRFGNRDLESDSLSSFLSLSSPHASPLVSACVVPLSLVEAVFTIVAPAPDADAVSPSFFPRLLRLFCFLRSVARHTLPSHSLSHSGGKERRRRQEGRG